MDYCGRKNPLNFAGDITQAFQLAAILDCIWTTHKKLRKRIHCLSSLLPPSNPANYMFSLRPRGHDL